MAAIRPQLEKANLSQSQGDRSSVPHRQREQVQQNAMFAAGRNPHHRGNLNPSVVDAAMQDGPQDPHHINAVYYHDHPPPPD
ncbi:hypothetical protein BGW80DRAFT_1560159, partial [Lactifluus volemus]